MSCEILDFCLYQFEVYFFDKLLIFIKNTPNETETVTWRSPLCYRVFCFSGCLINRITLKTSEKN